MRNVFVFLALGFITSACSDALVPPQVDQPGDTEVYATLPAMEPGESQQVVESVTGSGHHSRGSGQYWFTFTIHAQKTAGGEVSGGFQWRSHQGGGGSKVSGRVECFSVERNQAWLGVVFEKAGAEGNIGKWASIRVIDRGEGAGDPPDEISLRWRGFPAEGNMPEDFCRDHWTDQEIFPLEAGNIQVH